MRSALNSDEVTTGDDEMSKPKPNAQEMADELSRLPAYAPQVEATSGEQPTVTESADREAKANATDMIDRLINRGVVEIFPNREALRLRLLSGDKLRIYIGVDPTSPVIHLGHAVQLRKLRQFQDLGHQVILLIGDFTGRIGDPTDKSAARTQLTPEQVKENAQTYVDQASRILDLTSSDNPVEVRFNGEWWDRMNARDMIETAAYFTAQQLLQRDMFQKRLDENRPIGLHEFLYPLLQAYDSVALDVDIELGGTDQTFNMLCGRTLQGAIRGKEKFVITGPLLEGTDGQKMSKSLGNVIGVTDPPYEMYGLVMSLKDDLIVRYFELATDLPETEIEEIAEQLQANQVNPMDLKLRLARMIVGQYHGFAAADEAAARFAREVRRKETPTEMPDVELPRSGEWPLVDLLVEAKLAASRSEARRLIVQGSIQIDGEKIDDPRATVIAQSGTIVRGRRRQFVRLALPESIQ